MNRRASLAVLASGVFVFASVSGKAQTTANPNPSTLPVPTQTNPAGTGGSNTTAPPPDPTPPASTAPAPPPKQTAPPAPQNQQSAPTTNPAVEQTSPTGNNAIKNQPTPPSANPGSTTPGAAESAAGLGALNAGGLTSDQLHQRIDAALHSEPTLSGSNLTVNVSDDSIDLSGTVSNSKDRLTAHRIVQSFAGNRRVRERVTVAGGSPRSSTPNATKDQPATPTTEKSEVEKANRPITDPAKHGDASEEPRRM
jgi:hypothetical protein